MQVDAGSFILTIEQEFERVVTEYQQKGLLDAGEEFRVIAGHLLTRASLAAMIKHSLQAGLAPVPQVDDQTRTNIIKALGTPADQAKFRERGRKAAETRKRNTEARARAQAQANSGTVVSGQFGNVSQPSGGDGGAA